MSFINNPLANMEKLRQMNAEITEKEKEEEEEENMEAEEMIRETTERPVKKGRKSRNEMKKIDKEWKQFVRKNKGKFMELKLECEQRFGRSRAMVGKYILKGFDKMCKSNIPTPNNPILQESKAVFASNYVTN